MSVLSIRHTLPFEAFFAPNSDPEFTVAPTSGELTPAGTEGTLIKVSYKPQIYGKTHMAKLVVQVSKQASQSNQVILINDIFFLSGFTDQFQYMNLLIVARVHQLYPARLPAINQHVSSFPFPHTEPHKKKNNLLMI